MLPSTQMEWIAAAGGAVLAVLGALSARYVAARRRIERSWTTAVERKLDAIGEVDDLMVVPLVERLTPMQQLLGEPGVSYLLRAGKTTLLFDTGLNRRSEIRPALVQNADALHADLQRLDGVVISHVHPDHVGGSGSVRHRTFAFAAEPLEPKGLPAYVPAPMSHQRAEVVLTTGPRAIAPGIALLPPLPQMMFWLGPVSEQAVVVNVRGFGLVLISGWGHPGIERMLAVSELVLDVPIRAVYGGLHLPVHALGTPLMLQSTIGNPYPPWRPIGERDVASAIAEISARGPRLVALSSHDSSPWTYGAFTHAFGERYRTLQVGDELTVSAAGVRWRPLHSTTTPTP